MRNTRARRKRQSAINKENDTGITKTDKTSIPCSVDQNSSIRLTGEEKSDEEQEQKQKMEPKSVVENNNNIVDDKTSLLVVEGSVAESSTPAESLPESQSSSLQTTMEVEELKAEEDEEEDEIEGMREKQPKAKHQVAQRVFARDDVTGLLYVATVRKTQFGPRKEQINVHLYNDDDDGDNNSVQQDEDTEETYVWHYFVHYHGWNVRWDRWVEEGNLYLFCDETQILADSLKKEHQQLIKANKSKGRMKEKLISTIQKNMKQIEDEHRAKYGMQERPAMKKTQNPSEETDGKKTDDSSSACSTKAKKKHKKSSSSKVKSSTKKIQKWTKSALEKECKLREKDLEGKRRKIYAEKINIPFGLKKELVDEWEIISQCNMVHNLPASVTVADSLQAYKQGKLDIIRGVDHHNKINSIHPEEVISSATSNNAMNPDQVISNKEVENTLPLSEEEAEWEGMVEDIKEFFDDALQTHLLYRQERAQYFLMESRSTFKNKRFCEIYGCEYLLRLFIRIPSLLLQSNIDNEKANKIFFKIGDFVRFLQKHQSRFFSHSYRKYKDEENAIAIKIEEGDESYIFKPNLKSKTKHAWSKKRKRTKNSDNLEKQKTPLVNNLSSNDQSVDLIPLSSLTKGKLKTTQGKKKKRKLEDKSQTKYKKKKRRNKNS